MKYSVTTTTSSIGYYAGENTIEVNDNSISGTMQKIAAGLGWQRKSGSSTIYIIK